MALVKIINTALGVATPSAAGTTVTTNVLRGLAKFQAIMFDIKIVGGTGGTLDVYLQKALDGNQTVWRDYVHFTQVAAGATAYYAASAVLSSSLAAVGDGSSPALAANSIAPGHPGDAVRLVFVAGTGTSAAGSVDLYVTGWNSH